MNNAAGAVFSIAQGSRFQVHQKSKFSLRIWTQVRKFFRLYDFPVFREWNRKGIVCFRDLFIDNTFASFEQLRTKFGLLQSHFFRYLQARHYVLSELSNPPRPVLSLNPSQKRLISVLYNMMLAQGSAPLVKLRAGWEEDLGLPLSEEMWTSVLKLVISTSLCARHTLIQFKVVHRAHISKAKLASFYPDVSPLCDKCNIFEGSLFHMYWSCPSLKKFWTEVFHTLSQVLGVSLEPQPLTALFGVTGGQLRLSAGGRRTLAFTSLRARRLILLRWRDPTPPTHAQWLMEVMSCLKQPSPTLQ